MKKKEENWLEKIALAGNFETPYMVTDIAVVREKCKVFKEKLPDVQLFYAIKAFSDKSVLRSIDKFVDGYDAASEAEIETLLEIGVSPGRIAFSNPVKPEKAIERAFKLGVKKYAFQSREELEKLSRQTMAAEVYVRVKMDDAHSAVPLSVKYGCHPEEAVELLKYAQSLGAKPVGLTFHVGSQQTGMDAWGKAIRLSQTLIEEAHAQGLTDVCLVNLGGGFPAEYTSDDPSIHDVASVINEAIEAGVDKSVKYMAEPGRFIVADSSAIVASVIGREDRGGKTWLYLDVGVFQAFIGALRYDSFPYYPFSIRHLQGKDTKAGNKEYVLTGPSCDSQDIIVFDAQLPDDIMIGDRLLFPNVGAYTVVYGANFNGFKVPPRVFVDSHPNEIGVETTLRKGIVI